ncbi:MAG: 16S rRNA (uracil(1498)-N(3))-methyltransferase [Steroidobacteraceae bacterium]
MRLTRIFITDPLTAGTEVRLSASAGSHVARVLRLKEGAPLIVFDGTGGEHRAEIIKVAGSTVHVALREFMPGATEPALKLTLVQGVSRGERMDWTLQKATELGVSAIVPVLTARSVVRLDERQSLGKREHWQAVVASACEQCGRTRVPDIASPVRLRDYLATSKKEGLRLALSPIAQGSLAGLASVPQKVEMLIGPEGGLDDNEHLLAEQAGYLPVRLGPRVLRTETASVVALSVLQALWGDLQ